jgi:DNA-binding CsgD family transcriptional regulator
VTTGEACYSYTDLHWDAFQLTKRQRLILYLVAEGLTNAEIARRLHISAHTVAQHIAEMLRAVGARCRAELVARAYCDGMLPVGIWPPSPPEARRGTAMIPPARSSASRLSLWP